VAWGPAGEELAGGRGRGWWWSGGHVCVLWFVEVDSAGRAAEKRLRQDVGAGR
jgi:hypothetical protein